MRRGFLERPLPKMAVQAFAVVVGHVQLDLIGSWNCTQILDEQVPHAPDLGADGPKHRVIGVARVARLVPRHEVVLRVARGDVAGIVDIEASAVVVHDVAGETEGSRFGAVHLLGKAERSGGNRKNKQGHERQDLAFAGPRQARA